MLNSEHYRSGIKGLVGDHHRLRRGRVQGRVAVAALVVLVLAMPLPAKAFHAEIVDKVRRGSTERVSISSSGSEGNNHSGVNAGDPCPSGYSASDDGRYVAFASFAGNLHVSDTNRELIQDIFVYDRKREKLDLVSAMPYGSTIPNLPSDLDAGTLCVGALSFNPAISGNGRYVAFTSRLPLTDDAQSSVAMDNVFIRDLKTKSTQLVSRTWKGESPLSTLGGSGTDSVSISDDGRFVAFDSGVTNLTQDNPCRAHETIPGVPDPVSICRQMFVRDLDKEETFLVSRSTTGDPSNGLNWEAVISGNGRYVAFASAADNLVPDDVNACLDTVTLNPSCRDVFLHDVKSGETELISVSRNGGSASDASHNPQISDDGRFVLFRSLGKDLVPANISPTVTCDGLYIRDRKTSRTERVSVTSTGTMLRTGHASANTLSDSGRYVAFNTYQTDGPPLGCRSLPPGSHEYGGSILDRRSGQVDQRTSIPEGDASSAPPGTAFQIGSGYGVEIRMGGNGRFLVGASEYDNMVHDDTNDVVDVFVRDIGSYPLGAGPLGGAPPKSSGAPSGQDICIVPGTCIPPQGRFSRRAPAKPLSAPAESGAKLFGASLAYRPELGDLFVAIELEHMGPLSSVGAAGVVAGGASSLVYGLRFEVDQRLYEVRASGWMGGTFGLFECGGAASRCRQVSTLEGGYGTTGERVVFSLPLEKIGLSSGGELRSVSAFSAVGSYAIGATRILDRFVLRGRR